MRTQASRRGSVTFTALVLAVAVGGLSMALLTEATASKTMNNRNDALVRALEAAESGISKAEEEVSSQIDTGSDGIGFLSGSINSATYSVTATKDAGYSDRWTLKSVGTFGLSKRTVEVDAQRIAGGPWSYGLFAQQIITISGGLTSTDSYDSRLGTYASQAIHTDAVGTYANANGDIGTNAGNISDSGGGKIRGDATPGPGYTISLSGGSTVTGSTTPLTNPLDLTPTPLSTFQSKNTTNDDGTWTTTGGTTWNAVTKALTVSGGNTITLTGSTYFFTSLTLSGGSTLKITQYPTKLYVTGNVDFSGGSVSNTTGSAVNFQLYAYPYAVPSTFSPPVSPTVKLSGGSGSAYAVYAPAAAITISGASGVYGAVIGKTITPSGGSEIHYDEALADQLGTTAKVHRLYWRETTLPAR